MAVVARLVLLRWNAVVYGHLVSPLHSVVSKVIESLMAFQSANSRPSFMVAVTPLEGLCWQAS